VDPRSEAGFLMQHQPATVTLSTQRREQARLEGQLECPAQQIDSIGPSDLEALPAPIADGIPSRPAAALRSRLMIGRERL